MDTRVREYLAEIGRRGGKVSKRRLSPADAKHMVRVREARRAFRDFHARCFWSYDPNYQVTSADVGWVVEQLMKNGDRRAWKVAEKLCR